MKKLLYWNDVLPALPFLNRELLRGALPEPSEKNNTTYCVYCLTYVQSVKEDSYVKHGAASDVRYGVQETLIPDSSQTIPVLGILINI